MDGTAGALSVIQTPHRYCEIGFRSKRLYSSSSMHVLPPLGMCLPAIIKGLIYDKFKLTRLVCIMEAIFFKIFERKKQTIFFRIFHKKLSNTQLQFYFV